MNILKSEIENLEKWLSPRLGGLIAHGEKVREMLARLGGFDLGLNFFRGASG
jgi:hypothetical protein